MPALGSFLPLSVPGAAQVQQMFGQFEVSTTKALQTVEKYVEQSVKLQSTFLFVHVRGMPMFLPTQFVQWLQQFAEQEDENGEGVKSAPFLEATGDSKSSSQDVLCLEAADNSTESSADTDRSMVDVSELFSVSQQQQQQPPATGSCFVGGWAMHPHPAKLAQGETGEDALFIAAHGCAMGVADGVGGWRNKGGCTDPGMFSKTLISHCKTVADASLQFLDPLAILSSAYEAMDPSIPGSSTATIVTLDGDLLRTASLGDSGVMVIRRNVGLIFKSVEQQHYFNCPYQLGSASSDRPSHASIVSFTVEHGDVVLLASDGLFDNIYDDEIVDLVLENLHESATNLATIVADRAKQLSATQNYSSPFASKAQQAGLSYKSGGKLDDITVVASFVDLKPRGSCNLL